ncbi:peptide chain release factor N(5)-glutamine methyltransferase [Candidatus Kaiserbacteria bacterium]|nr:peptide chain release factor N(5)-glutamine methyltransferase [Candidatus Kaiserbacteria bacterium]
MWLLEEKYSGEKTRAYEKDKERLALGEPLAYVIGWQPFLGLKIYLDSRPLIPRPETEWWTEQLLKSESPERKTGVRLGRAARSAPVFRSGNEPLRFLDLCAGSGAIGCAALARLPASPELQRGEPNAQVYFGEIDPAHEATILKNIRTNGLDESRAHVRIGDLFSAKGGSASGGELLSSMKFDIIAANPPYIPASRTLPQSVADFEPALALMAGIDGLAIIRRIAAELPRHLTTGGTAWIECDSAHVEAAQKLFGARGLDAKIHNDQYDRPRFFVIKSRHV